MTIAIRSMSRVQDMDDVSVALSAAVDGQALAWDNDTSRWALRLVLGGANVRMVDPSGGGDYTTLSAALAAITDASDSKEYLVLVTGEVAETSTVTAKSHVHVLFLPGARLTVTSTSTSNAITFSSLVNTTWAAVDSRRSTIVRAGAVGGASYGVSLQACANTVRLVGLVVENTTTGTTGCHGVYIHQASNPTLTDCTFIGGAGGASCYGGLCNLDSSPALTDCTFIGGAGGASCYGMALAGNSKPELTGCTFIGGAGGTGCYGMYALVNTATRATDCLFIGGGADYRSATATIAARSRQEDTFKPVAAHPYRLITSVTVNVTAAAAAGVTLTLRDATGGGGNALTEAIDVASTGYKYAAITGYRTIAAAGNVYAYLSASDATLAYTVTCQYTVDYTQCYALYDASALRQDYISNNYVSNGESAAIYLSAAGITASMFAGGVAKSGLNSGTRQKAFICASAWNPGQVYKMALDGGSTNLTAAAGTANGSNIEF